MSGQLAHCSSQPAWSGRRIMVAASTRSRPPLRPETGKIGVKVINHSGDEVLKVYAM